MGRGYGKARSAFFFGLAAFQDDYRGLPAYVAARVPQEGTDTQKRILTYIAIAYYYGQQPVPAQVVRYAARAPDVQDPRLQERVLWGV